MEPREPCLSLLAGQAAAMGTRIPKGQARAVLGEMIPPVSNRKGQ